jgi:hypothetical protein
VLPQLSRLALLVGAVLAAALCVSCGDDDDGDAVENFVERVFAAQDNELRTYDIETGEMTVLIPSDQNNVNGQPCSLPDASGQFLMGEDTDQDEGARQGWGIFEADGTFVRKIEEPVTEGEAETPDPFGCGFDEEGRLFTTDVGTGSFESEDGKLMVFFPPEYDDYCVLDSTIKTAGAVAIDGQGRVYVPQTVPPGQILRYTPPFPASADQCDSVTPARSVFIEDPEMSTPLGIAEAANGNWFVSSVVIPPTVREYDPEGNFVRVIAEGEGIGNPAGIAVAVDGTIYYADLGLVEQPPPEFFGPEPGEGSIYKVLFDAEGNPSPPQVVDDGLTYPDNIAVLLVPPAEE